MRPMNSFDQLSKREYVMNTLKCKTTTSLQKLIIVSILETCSEVTRKLAYYQHAELLEFALLMKQNN